jgi:mono/diheme cytochrome c family protein
MRTVSAFAALSLPLVLAACGPRLQGPVTEPHVAPAVASVAATPLAEGERIFNEVCSQCHTLGPPPNLAPPMRMVAMHLRRSFDGEEAAVDHIVSYAAAPDAERSILPAHAVARFGLMPSQPLRPDQLRKVAAYVWSLGGGGNP